MASSPNALGSFLRYFTDATSFARQDPDATKARRRALLFDTQLKAMTKNYYNADEPVDVDELWKMTATSAWLWPNITLITNRVATAFNQMEVKERKDDELVDIKNHPIEILLQRPNPLFDGMLVVKYSVMWFLMRGNGYWFISTSSPGKGEPEELWPLDSSEMVPDPTTMHYGRGVFKDKPVIDYIYTIEGQEHKLPGENVVHWRTANPWDMWQGLAPLVAAQQALEVDWSQSEWLRTFYGEDNAVPTAIISLPAEIDDQTFEFAKERIREDFSQKRRSAITRAGDLKVEVIDQALKDMEMVASREFNSGQLDRVYSVPEGLITGALSGDSRLAVEITFARNTIQPLVDSLASVLDGRLTPYYEDADVLKGPNVIPQDRALDMSEFTTHSPYKTVNESREELGLKEYNHEMADVPVKLLDIVAKENEQAAQAENEGNSGRDDPFASDGGDGGETPSGQEPTDSAEEDDATGSSSIFGIESVGSQVSTVAGKAMMSDAQRVAVKTELRRWRKVAGRIAKRGGNPLDRHFDSVVIPIEVRAAITAGITGVTEPEAVKAVFNDVVAQFDDGRIELTEADSESWKASDVGGINVTYHMLAEEYMDAAEILGEAMKRQGTDSGEEGGSEKATAPFATKHHGPGPHPSGSPQSVHGSGGDTTTSDPMVWIGKIAENELHRPQLEGGAAVMNAQQFLNKESRDPGNIMDWWEENQFSDIDVLREAYEVNGPGGYKTAIETINVTVEDNSLMITGYAYDPDGKIIGEFSAIWAHAKPDQLSGSEVWHTHLVIDPQHQATGLAGYFVERLETIYQSAGIKSVSMSANFEVGGYAWARMGYDFARDVDRTKMRTRINSAVIADHQAGLITGSVAGAKVSELGGLSRAWEFAAFEAGDRRVGKEVMLGTSWMATKRLGGIGDAVGNAYYKAKVRKFQSGKSDSSLLRKVARRKDTAARHGWFITPEGGDAALWPDIDGPVDDAWVKAVRKIEPEDPTKSYPGPDHRGLPGVWGGSRPRSVGDGSEEQSSSEKLQAELNKLSGRDIGYVPPHGGRPWFGEHVKVDVPDDRIFKRDMDLNHADFSGMTLDVGSAEFPPNFNSVSAVHVNFAGAKMDLVQMIHAEMPNSDFHAATLTRAKMRKSDMSNCDFSEADMRWVNMEDANVEHSDFTDAKLFKADAEGLQADGARFEGAKLQGAEFYKASFRGANLKKVIANGSYFEGSDLSSANLDEGVFGDSHFKGANLSNAKMNDADFTGSSLVKTNMNDAGGHLVNFEYAFMHDAEMKNAQFQMGQFGHAVMQNVNAQGMNADGGYFNDAVLNFADFTGGSFYRATFNEAKAKGVIFAAANLDGASFVAAKLEGADFQEASMVDVDFTGANLERAHLGGVDFGSASFRGADLGGANLRGADLSQCDMADAYMEGAKIDAKTRLPSGMEVLLPGSGRITGSTDIPQADFPEGWDVQDYSSNQEFREGAQSGKFATTSSLGGGVTGTDIVQIEGDGRGVRKAVVGDAGVRRHGESRQEYEDRGFNASAHSGYMEMAAYDVSDMLGLDIVPETVVVGDSTVQMFVEDSETGYQMIREMYRDDTEQSEGAVWAKDFVATHEEDILKMRVLDAIIGNNDRHPGNHVVDPNGRMWAIDHGHARAINGVFGTKVYMIPETDNFVTAVLYRDRFKTYTTSEPVRVPEALQAKWRTIDRDSFIERLSRPSFKDATYGLTDESYENMWRTFRKFRDATHVVQQNSKWASYDYRKEHKDLFQ